MSRINIVTPDNGVGLSQDRAILRRLFEAYGHECFYSTTPNPISTSEHYDLNVFLEVVYPNYFRLARKNMLVPNPEWFYKEWERHVNRFDAIACKTHHTHELFSKLSTNAQYTSFTSWDMNIPNVERRNTFAQFAGKSSHKGTNELIEATNLRALPHITIYTHNPNRRFIDYSKVDRNKVTIYSERMNHDAMKLAFNANRFHVCTSNYEGFGHYINEARSVGAIIITTNAAPMNEIVKPSFGFGVGSVRSQTKHNMVYLHKAIPSSIASAIEAAQQMDESLIEECSANARAAYLAGYTEFEELFLNLIYTLL